MNFSLVALVLYVQAAKSARLSVQFVENIKRTLNNVVDVVVVILGKAT